MSETVSPLHLLATDAFAAWVDEQARLHAEQVANDTKALAAYATQILGAAATAQLEWSADLDVDTDVIAAVADLPSRSGRWLLRASYDHGSEVQRLVLHRRCPLCGSSTEDPVGSLADLGALYERYDT
jgi:hypothetical protein